MDGFDGNRPMRIDQFFQQLRQPVSNLSIQLIPIWEFHLARAVWDIDKRELLSITVVSLLVPHLPANQDQKKKGCHTLLNKL